MSDSCSPVDYSPPGSSVHEILRQEYWSGLPCPPPGDLPDPGIEHASLTSPSLAGGFFTTKVTWGAPMHGIGFFLWPFLGLLNCHWKPFRDQEGAAWGQEWGWKRKRTWVLDYTESTSSEPCPLQSIFSGEVINALTIKPMWNVVSQIFTNLQFHYL